MEVSRFYILRDNALFVYKDETQKYPYRVYPLRGLYVSIKTEKDSKTNNDENSGNIDSSWNAYGKGNSSLTISHDIMAMKPISLFHPNQDAVISWAHALKF